VKRDSSLVTVIMEYAAHQKYLLLTLVRS